MFFVISKVLYFLIMPFTWVAFLLLGAVFFKRKRKRLLIYTAITFFLFSNPFIANKVMSVWEMPSQTYDAVSDDYDVGIILGGTIKFYHGPLQRPLYGRNSDRFLSTVELYKRNKIKKILISGGSGKLMRPEEREAVLLFETLKQLGVAADDIILENESRSTHENAKYTTEILKRDYPNGKFLLITSAFHMRRSLMCFKKQDLSVAPFPVDQRSGEDIYTPDKTIIPDAENFIKWTTVIHEWIGIIAYKIVGYI
ncbi:MAG: YdcF family protein [Bacteroidia bacterium]|nr:YdcF family protein [Bacteroidia bacterium]